MITQYKSSSGVRTHIFIIREEKLVNLEATKKTNRYRHTANTCIPKVRTVLLVNVQTEQ